jgi:hypothetical protein
MDLRFLQIFLTTFCAGSASAEFTETIFYETNHYITERINNNAFCIFLQKAMESNSQSIVIIVEIPDNMRKGAIHTRRPPK